MLELAKELKLNIFSTLKIVIFSSLKNITFIPVDAEESHLLSMLRRIKHAIAHSSLQRKCNFIMSPSLGLAVTISSEFALLNIIKRRLNCDFSGVQFVQALQTFLAILCKFSNLLTYLQMTASEFHFKQCCKSVGK